MTNFYIAILLQVAVITWGTYRTVTKEQGRFERAMWTILVILNALLLGQNLNLLYLMWT